MIALRFEAPFGSFRTSFARSYAETYVLPPPSTIYGMLLSLVGERQRRSHLDVRIAIAFERQPRLATVLKKLSRYKYGVPSKQSSKGNAPDYVEVLCGIQGHVFIDSSREPAFPKLEERITQAIDSPEHVDRTGLLCLGLSDDMVDLSRFNPDKHRPPNHWLTPDNTGSIELPVWVDHVGSANTRWRRFRLTNANGERAPSDDLWISIQPPEKLCLTQNNLPSE